MIPYEEFGGSGPVLVFLHANGYSPGCYGPLLHHLAEQFSVKAMLQRPLWEGSNPQAISDWLPLSHDLLRFLSENQVAPALIVGHSLGGIVALRAALRQPAYFRALVLIEPVLLPPTRILQWQLLRMSRRIDRHPMIVASQDRRQSFDDLDRLFRAYRHRPIFRFMNDAALRTYINSMVSPAGDGTYRLRYPAEWETRIYATGIWRDLDLWLGLPRLKVPTLILRGAESDTFWGSTARGVRRLHPAIEIKSFPETSHLLPMEEPGQTGDAIHEFFSRAVHPVDAVKSSHAAQTSRTP